MIEGARVKEVEKDVKGEDRGSQYIYRVLFDFSEKTSCRVCMRMEAQVQKQN